VSPLRTTTRGREEATGPGEEGVGTRFIGTLHSASLTMPQSCSPLRCRAVDDQGNVTENALWDTFLALMPPEPVPEPVQVRLFCHASSSDCSMTRA
jgi:hypothetical protein